MIPQLDQQRNRKMSASRLVASDVIGGITTERFALSFFP
jgi:hypothetical protein